MTDHDPTTAEKIRATGRNPIRFRVRVERVQNRMVVSVEARRGDVSATSDGRSGVDPDRGIDEREATRIATEEACNLAASRVLGAELAIAHVMEP